MRSSTLEFHSIEAAQRWLDANPNYRNPHSDHARYVATYGAPAGRCVKDCMVAAAMFNLDRSLGETSWPYWTSLKMAARRLSSALAVHHPRTFG